MDIVHDLNQLDCGGVEKVIASIIKFDKQNKHTVITYRDGIFREKLEKIGANVICAPKEKDPDVEIDCDVIHIHCGGAVSEMAKKLGKAFPVIETIHSPVRSPNRCEYVRRRVGVTDTVSRLNHDCVTIRNGIDFSEIKSIEGEASLIETRQELGIPKSATVIGRLGRLGHDKCLEHWLLTCYELQRRGLDCYCLIVGDEAHRCDGYRGKLKLMAASLPVKNVIWAGHRWDIAWMLGAMDVFLYPSPTEGFGLVFAEAMYCGVPVVTYKNDVTMEVCGGYAVLTDKSISALADGVEAALDRQIKDEIVPLAYHFALDEYDAERMSLDYQNLYRSVACAGKETVAA